MKSIIDLGGRSESENILRASVCTEPQLPVPFRALLHSQSGLVNFSNFMNSNELGGANQRPERRGPEPLPEPGANPPQDGLAGVRAAAKICALAAPWLFVLALLAGTAAAQISPGPLARQHQFLDGTIHCTECHKLGGSQPEFKCISCHSDIGTRVAEKRGLHASYRIPAGSSQECVRCHSDHNGANFTLIKWDPNKFDHKETGYLLEGKHAGLPATSVTFPSGYPRPSGRTSRKKTSARLSWEYLKRALPVTRISTKDASARNVCNVITSWTGKTQRENSITPRHAIRLPACTSR